MKAGMFAVLLATTSVAAAQPATARLDVSGACELAQLEARSNELLGRAGVVADARAQIAIATHVEGGAQLATLSFVDEHGAAQPARTITAASCNELGESIAVVISLVLRQNAPPPPPARAPPPPPPAPVREDDSVFAPAPPPAKALALELGAALATTMQTSIVLGGRFERARFALGVDLEVPMPETVELGTASVHVMSLRADAAGCFRARGFAACGLLIGGLVRARGEDLMNARTAFGPLAAAGARVEWRQPASRRAGVRIFASVEQLLARPRIVVDSTEVWAIPEREAALGAGLFFQMP
jgi:hypothetical protein